MRSHINRDAYFRVNRVHSLKFVCYLLSAIIALSDHNFTIGCPSVVHVFVYVVPVTIILLNNSPSTLVDILKVPVLMFMHFFGFAQFYSIYKNL